MVFGKGRNKKSVRLTPLMTAAKNGDVNAAEELIKKGVNIHEEDHSGTQALAYAFGMDGGFLSAENFRMRSKIAKMLLDQGADINHQDQDGWVPVMHFLNIGLPVGVNVSEINFIFDYPINLELKNAVDMSAKDMVFDYWKNSFIGDCFEQHFLDELITIDDSFAEKGIAF